LSPPPQRHKQLQQAHKFITLLSPVSLIPSLSPADAESTSAAAAFPPFLKTDPQESKPNLLLVSSSHLHISIGNPHHHQPQQQTKYLRNSSPKSNPQERQCSCNTSPSQQSQMPLQQLRNPRYQKQQPTKQSSQNKHKHKQKPLFIFPVLKIFLSLQL
jgi:hypothetical protein